MARLSVMGVRAILGSDWGALFVLLDRLGILSSIELHPLLFNG